MKLMGVKGQVSIKRTYQMLTEHSHEVFHRTELLELCNKNQSVKKLISSHEQRLNGRVIPEAQDAPTISLMRKRQWRTMKEHVEADAGPLVKWQLSSRFCGYAQTMRKCNCEEEKTLSTKHILTCSKFDKAYEPQTTKTRHPPKASRNWRKQLGSS